MSPPSASSKTSSCEFVWLFAQSYVRELRHILRKTGWWDGAHCQGLISARLNSWIPSLSDFHANERSVIVVVTDFFLHCPLSQGSKNLQLFGGWICFRPQVELGMLRTYAGAAFGRGYFESVLLVTETSCFLFSLRLWTMSKTSVRTVTYHCQIS